MKNYFSVIIIFYYTGKNGKNNVYNYFEVRMAAFGALVITALRAHAPLTPPPPTIGTALDMSRGVAILGGKEGQCSGGPGLFGQFWNYFFKIIENFDEVNVSTHMW